MKILSVITAAIICTACSWASAESIQKKPLPLTSKPPRGAVILFDGSDTSAWIHQRTREPARWIVKDGSLEARPGTGDIMTRQQFGDCRLHLEFNLPLMPEATSQGRANSGVYLQGRYEIQILDSWQNPTYPTGGVGAIYGQKDPDKDSIRPPGVWQSYDILFTAGRVDSAGKVTARPRITVYHNGILIHNDVEIQETRTTQSIGGKVELFGPILLQDHGNRVRYRNIWVVSNQVAGDATRAVSKDSARVTTWD